MQGFDAAGQRVQVDPLAPSFVACFESYEGDDQLKIVLHAVLQLAQQDILVADPARILLTLGTRPVGDVDQRRDAIVLGPVLVLNETGEGLDNERSRPLRPEGAEKL